MRPQLFPLKPLLLSVLAATLAACGAGSSTSTDSAPGSTTPVSESTVVQGQFLDSAVSGLWYETATQRGFTNEFGSFSYVPGESVTFYLGSTLLGTVTAQGEITPLDLISATDNPDKLQNLLRVLQTLDADSDPSNGIEINQTAQDYLNQYALPLNSPALIFEANSVIQNMVAAVTNGTGLKDAVASFVHFRETMLSSRRNLDTTPILNLLNTTWDAQISSTACDDSENARLVYNFNLLGVASAGYHRLDASCRPTGYGARFNTYETEPLFTCANQCLDADLNRVITDSDANGDVVTTLRYDAEQQQITIRTTRFDGYQDVTTTQVLTRR